MDFDSVINTVKLLGTTDEEPIITDEELQLILSLCVRPDAEGLIQTNLDWIPTYNIYAALSKVWELKAAKYVRSVNFSADGQNFALAQRFEHCLTMAKIYKGKSFWAIELQREALLEEARERNLVTWLV